MYTLDIGRLLVCVYAHSSTCTHSVHTFFPRKHMNMYIKYICIYPYIPKT